MAENQEILDQEQGQAQNDQQQQSTEQNAAQQADASVDFDIEIGEQKPIDNGDAKPQEQQPAAVQQDWKELVKSVDKKDLFAAIGHEEVELDDFLKELHEHRKNGGNTFDYIFHKTKDWDKESDLNLLEQKLKRENPTLTSDEVDALLADTYGFGDDDAGVKAIKAKADAHTERVAMKDLQSKFKIAEAEKPQQQEQPNIATVEDLVQNLSKEDDIKKMIESKKVTISIKDVGNFNFPVANPDKILALMAGDMETFKEIRFKDGKPNIQNELFATLVQAYGADTIVKGIRASAIAQYQKQDIKEQQNATREAATAHQGNGSTTSNVRVTMN